MGRIGLGWYRLESDGLDWKGLNWNRMDRVGTNLIEAWAGTNRVGTEWNGVGRIGELKSDWVGLGPLKLLNGTG